ncbi:MAG: hypothetical protein Q9186_004062, partial [Xanthomendoza sp. 1 TL-2023]
LTTLFALALDVHIQRKFTHRGQYNQIHGLDLKRSIPIISQSVQKYEPFSSQPAEHETGDLGEQRPYEVQESIGVQQFRYNAPTEQTMYGPVYGMR